MREFAQSVQLCISAEMDLLYTKVADWAREALKKSGMTQARLAQKAGVSQPDVSRFMKGQASNMYLQKCFAILDVLGAKILFPDELEKLKTEVAASTHAQAAHLDAMTDIEKREFFAAIIRQLTGGEFTVRRVTTVLDPDEPSYITLKLLPQNREDDIHDEAKPAERASGNKKTAQVPGDMDGLGNFPKTGGG